MSRIEASFDLDSAYALTDEQIARFRHDGYVKLKDVFDAATLAHYGRAITQRVMELNDLADVPWEKRDTYQKAFIQVMNLWLKDETVKQFVFGKRLARIAAELMGVDGVRLYHDQALYKEPARDPGAGHTPWHADEYYWPLDTSNTCTAWIPLQATPLEMGPLSFAAGSHRHTIGRDMEISDASEAMLGDELMKAGYPHEVGPFDLGEVSFHYGWTYHRAGPNRSGKPREVMTVIFMDAAAKATQPINKHQANDLATWLPGVKPGQPAASEINPVLWAKGE